MKAYKVSFERSGFLSWKVSNLISYIVLILISAISTNTISFQDYLLEHTNSHLVEFILSKRS